MYFVASVLDPCIKCILIKEQYSDEADEIIAKVQAYLKKEYQKQVVPQSESESIELPPDINVYAIGLLCRVRKSNASTICNIDWYLESDTLDWDEKDKSNYDPDWVLK